MTSAERIVLIAERAGHARDLEEHFLRDLGLLVEVASDGRVAWEAARRLKPDLVVSEILLPQVDGLALCRKIKDDPATRNTPVLLVSVLLASARARDAGADGFLLKPLSEQRLAAEVTRLIPFSKAEEQA